MGGGQLNENRQTIGGFTRSLAVILVAIACIQIGYGATPRALDTITRGSWGLTCNKGGMVESTVYTCNNIPLNAGYRYMCPSHNLAMERRFSTAMYCTLCHTNLTSFYCPSSHSYRHCDTSSCSNYQGNAGFRFEPSSHSHSSSCPRQNVYHSHTGNTTSGGSCYNVYMPAISFIDRSGATGNQPSPITKVSPGNRVTLPSNTFRKAGYTFKGWKGIRGMTGTYQPGQSITMPTITTDITMQAVWAPNTNTTFKIEFYQQQ